MIRIACRPQSQRKTNQVCTSKGHPNSPAEASRCFDRTREVLHREIGFIASPSFTRGSRGFGTAHPIVQTVESGHADQILSARMPNLPGHLKQLCATPILSAEEEAALFRRMNFLKYRANCLRSSLNTDHPKPTRLNEIADLLGRAERIRNHLINANVRLVISISKKFADLKNTFDEMLSDGIMSLMRAIEKFDCDRGFRFSTYATRAVTRDMYRKVMKTQKERQRSVSGADDFFADFSHDADEQRKITSPDNNLYKALETMIVQLDGREQTIIRARFGFDSEGGRNSTYVSIAKQLGISKERVRQLAERAIVKLRMLATEAGLEDSLT